MADKVLIVDDDVQTLQLIGMMLDRQGYKVLNASSGTQALQMAHNELPDVIVLDVMMPDIDGYEVTRRLRKDPDTASIPVLMFTAKTQVDDKITGYEAGADDYITKPVHPAELSAHLRALLARRKTNPPALKERAYVVGVVAAKGGLGVSSLALNLAIAFQQKTKAEVIAVETRPGQGSWGLELGNSQCEGLTKLLQLRAQDITATAVENELVRTPYGVRLLLANARVKDSSLMTASEPLEAVVEHLPLFARLVILDIGTSFAPAYDMLLNRCNEVIVVTEPFPTSVQRTRYLVEDLGGRGFGRSKPMTVVSINRIRADVQQSITQMQEVLGVSIAQVIPPAPEIAFQAANRGIPLIQVQIGGAVGQQYTNLAERLIQRVLA